ncbi:hypothetical protein PGT21_019070 [Puccinia graminis f. sp. tritici]|uniref:Uncharacterized protein n=1 Tax=Puccinia graminis f. sp. tritici TaxID=56615 RepID=A0A5B0QIB6_PUCGR|nr:hypothetical protein PGT21_019070 [Puccinia graminis f. sp. tritici]
MYQTYSLQGIENVYGDGFVRSDSGAPMPSESRQIFRAETFNIRYTSAEPSCQTESAKTRAPELGKKPEGSPTSNSRGRSELSRFGVPQTASREIEHRLTTSATSPLKDESRDDDKIWRRKDRLDTITVVKLAEGSFRPSNLA